MKYTTQFRISPDVPSHYTSEHIEYMKRDFAADLGILIGEKVGFKETKPNEYTIEVAVFPAEQWNNFKKDLYMYVLSPLKDSTLIINL